MHLEIWTKVPTYSLESDRAEVCPEAAPMPPRGRPEPGRWPRTYRPISSQPGSECCCWAWKFDEGNKATDGIDCGPGCGHWQHQRWAVAAEASNSCGKPWSCHHRREAALQRSSRQRKAVPSHWPLKRALPAGWLLFLSLVTGSSYTRLHFATLCACVMAGSHSLCHHSARVARRTPLAMHCPVQSAVTQPSGTMRWETSQPVCCGKYATTWQQNHLFSLWLVKPSLPALSSATTRLAWTSPRVAFGAVGSRKHFLM